MDRINVRHGTSLMVAFFLAAFTACGGDDSTGPTGGGGGGGGGATFTMTTNVSVGNNFFSPENAQVSPGATVTFTWAGGVIHNVNFSNASITDIGDKSGGSGTVTMPTTAGDYTYVCDHHGSMTGTIRVQ